MDEEGATTAFRTSLGERLTRVEEKQLALKDDTTHIRTTLHSHANTLQVLVSTEQACRNGIERLDAQGRALEGKLEHIIIEQAKVVATTDKFTSMYDDLRMVIQARQRFDGIGHLVAWLVAALGVIGTAVLWVWTHVNLR